MTDPMHSHDLLRQFNLMHTAHQNMKKENIMFYHLNITVTVQDYMLNSTL